MKKLRRAMLVALIPCLVTVAAAGVKTHEVRGGESMSSIARHYYGSFDPTDVLLRFNDRTDATIRVGETLRIPYSEVHRVASGDTWSKLSERYLESASAYRTIAMLNGLSPEAPLAIGQKIVMPVVLTYRLAPGDTLAVIAKRFYGDHERSAVLRTFNGIEDPRRLSVGQEIRVPLITLTLTDQGHASRESTPAASAPEPTLAEVEQPPAPPEPVVVPTPEPARAAAPEPEAAPEPTPEPEPEPQPAPEPAPRFAAEIDRARLAFRHGEFERARELVSSLRRDVDERGTREDRRELLWLQASVYVAFDLPGKACEAYHSLLEVDARRTMNPQQVSPKIRETLSACR